MRRYFHQCCKSKFCLFSGLTHIFGHYFCKIHKLTRHRKEIVLVSIYVDAELQCLNNYMTELLVTWKLSKARAGMLSSNSLIISQGPSPTPTKMIDRGYSLILSSMQAIDQENLKLAIENVISYISTSPPPTDPRS